MNPYVGQRGFTLLEMMVTVAILALLVSIAYPSYTSYVKRGNRGDAEAQLMRMAQAEERYRTTNDVYTASTTALSIMGASSVSPSTAAGNNAKVIYRLSAPTITNTAANPYYLLQATPQAGTLNANTGNLTIDSNGQKCWQKLSATDCTSWNSN